MSMLDNILLRTVTLLDRSGDAQVSSSGLRVSGARVSAGAIDFGHFNVLEFGATGDGIHDDTDGLQAAVDAAVASGRTAKIFFPPPPVVYRITRPLIIGTDFAPVDELASDYRKLIYGETPWWDVDALAGANRFPLIHLTGDGSPIWLDFDSLPADASDLDSQQALSAGIYFGLPANLDRTSMDAHSSVRGVTILGKYAFKNGAYVQVASQPNPELAGQVGIVFPGVTNLNFEHCCFNGLHTGYVATDCYWALISQIVTYNCAYGHRLHRHNAGHIFACLAFGATRRGYVITGQDFDAHGIHTEGCVGDVHVPQADSSFLGHLYLENGNKTTTVPMLEIGDALHAEQSVGRLSITQLHCGVTPGISSAASVSFKNASDVVLWMGDVPRVAGEYSFAFLGGGSPPVVIGGQRANENVDPAHPGDIRQIVIEALAEPDYNTWGFQAGIAAIKRLGMYSVPVNVDEMPIGNTYAGAFNGTATGSGVASFTQGAGVAAGAAYAENTSGAGTYHGYRSSGPKNNAVNNFHFSARITIPNASNYDFAVGLQSSVSTALAPSILIGVQRAVSTDHISLQVAANGGTTIGTVSGVSGVSCATGGQFELEMWWVRGDSHVYWAVNGVDQTPISCALIGTSDLGSAMLPGFWFSVASGATQVCYLERMRLGWS